MFKSKKIKRILVISIICMIFIIYNVFFRNNDIFALSKYGSRGDEVVTIQTKLKRWGYYSGNIDGVYGSKTLSAVKWFQSKNRIKSRWDCWNKYIKGYGNIYEFFK